MTPLGTGPVPLNDDVPVSYYQYAPLFGVDPGGDVLMGWYETDSSQDNTDAMARVLGDGAFADAGVIGPRLQLDGPSPEGAWVTAVVPGPAGIATAFSWTNARVCRASRVDLATKAVAGTDVIPGTGCAAPVGPASGANGTVATWTEYPSWQVALSRYVTAAPACSDGAPATVEAGKSVTLALPCTGWRPQREVTGAPARGALGTIDQDAGTVTYTAGRGGRRRPGALPGRERSRAERGALRCDHRDARADDAGRPEPAAAFRTRRTYAAGGDRTVAEAQAAEPAQAAPARPGVLALGAGDGEGRRAAPREGPPQGWALRHEAAAAPRSADA